MPPPPQVLVNQRSLCTCHVFLPMIKWAGLPLLLLCSRWRWSAPPSAVLSVKPATPISIRATSLRLHWLSSTTEQLLWRCIQAICLESVSSLTLGPSDIVGSSDFARSAKIGSIEPEHVIHMHMVLNWTVLLFSCSIIHQALWSDLSSENKRLVSLRHVWILRQRADHL